jgi:prophage regulatory protein
MLTKGDDHMSKASSQQNLYLTAEQVADRFGVSTDTIYRWKRQDKFPKAVRLSPGTTRWRLSDIIAHEATFETCVAMFPAVPPEFAAST